MKSACVVKCSVDVDRCIIRMCVLKWTFFNFNVPFSIAWFWLIFFFFSIFNEKNLNSKLRVSIVNRDMSSYWGCWRERSRWKFGFFFFFYLCDRRFYWKTIFLVSFSGTKLKLRQIFSHGTVLGFGSKKKKKYEEPRKYFFRLII